MTVKFISGANIKKYHPCGQSGPIPISPFWHSPFKIPPTPSKINCT